MTAKEMAEMAALLCEHVSEKFAGPDGSTAICRPCAVRVLMAANEYKPWLPKAMAPFLKEMIARGVATSDKDSE